MARRRRSSSGLIGGILRFFGISSPAVLIMAAMSYFGFRMPAPSNPADSPDAIAKRAKTIVDTVVTAKEKIKDRFSSFGSTDEPAAKPAKDDEEHLLHVAYQELFDDKPTSNSLPPPVKISLPKAPPVAKPPAISDNRDRKKGKYDDDFPEFNTYR
jgi:hypothetical protein